MVHTAAPPSPALPVPVKWQTGRLQPEYSATRYRFIVAKTVHIWRPDATGIVLLCWIFLFTFTRSNAVKIKYLMQINAHTLKCL